MQRYSIFSSSYDFLKEIESIRKPLEQDRDAKLAQLRKELEVQHTQVRTIAFYLF